MVQHASTSGSPYSFQRSIPDASGSKRRLKSKKAGFASKPATPDSAAPAPRTPELPSPFARFPWEIVYQVLQIAAMDQSNAIALLSLSTHHTIQLKQHTYHSVSLATLPAIENFAALLRKQPEVGRLVRNLWIGPTTMDSDLLSALAPPEHNENPTTLDARHRANAFTRAILRACRKTEHLALSGGLCNPASTHGYGTAIQPKELTCINPHSFVGGFGAPVFAKTEKIHLIDVSLTTDETDHLVRLPNLTTLTWTSPRDDGDATGDARKIVDLAWQCAGHEEPAPSNLPLSPEFNRDSAPPTDLLLSQPLTQSGPSKLQHVHVVTSPTRREMLRRALNMVDHIRLDESDPEPAVQPIEPEVVDANAADHPPTPPYILPPNFVLPPHTTIPMESDALSAPLSTSMMQEEEEHNSFMPTCPQAWRPLTPPPDLERDLLDSMQNLALDPPLPEKRIMVQTSTLPHSVVEEWQALRDEILSLQYRWDGYRPPKKKKQSHPAYPDDVQEPVAPQATGGLNEPRSREYKSIEESFAEGSEALEYFHRQWLFVVAKSVKIRR